MFERRHVYSDGNSRGFTLLEILAVILLLGITAAIASPSLLGFLARAKVDSAFSELRAMLQLAQRNAIRNSKTCTMFLPENNSENGVLTSDCSVTGNETLEDARIKYNRANSKKVSFSYRGNTGSLRTIVVYSESTNFKRCMVISNGLGMMRSGVYTRNDLTTISASYCQTTRY
ncbi:hypothetical protein Lepto7376_1813 [[Leptolyngbya] sp. PCC 7376]|uniref:type II secretion system protein n=1 Tax=[Leptolyngbya] sp. PCC 7376 TaxID=111781 RepID=UPI00029EC663|nr:type II secretion system protein [[Leptolyngbya] sp. PCC 7376]AFY38141.1 hypothetical protein Lepto7376_1813 [[Leptolyngbya] sp. PCC 7376]